MSFDDQPNYLINFLQQTNLHRSTIPLDNDAQSLAKLECLFWPELASGTGFWDRKRSYTSWDTAVSIQEHAAAELKTKKKNRKWGWSQVSAMIP